MKKFALLSGKKKLILNFVLIAGFLALLTCLAVWLGPEITRLAGKPEQLRDLLNSYGWKSVLVFMLIQLLQVVVAVIPGEFVQFAGGYIYGTWLGTLYSLAGITAGSVIVFFVARLLGYPIVKTFVSQKNLEKFGFMMNSGKSEIAMFILFLIPGIPKDILTYIAGLTPVKPLRFFIIIIIGRLPALTASSYIGYHTWKGNYTTVIILSAAALVLFAAGVLLRDRIIGRFRSAENDALKDTSDFTGQDIKISAFDIEDYNRAYELWKAVFPVNTDSSYDRENVSRFLERNPGTSFIAEDGDRLVGAVLAGNDGRRGYIHHLGVLEEYRRKGVGKRLIAEAEAALGRLGISKVHLFVFKSNVRAKAFYRKLGYVERDELGIFSHKIE